MPADMTSAPTPLPNAAAHASFSTRGFWRTARKLAARGGQKVLGSALTLYFCLKDAETPT